MSLTAAQKKQTSMELHENYRILDFRPEQIQADLWLSARELTNTLNIGFMSNPTTVWKLRDYMEEKILAQGKTPVPYSTLHQNIYYPYERDWD